MLDMAEPEKHARPWRLKFHLHHHTNSTSDQAAHPVVLTHHNSNTLANQAAHPAHPPATRIDFTQNIPTDIPYPPFVNVEGVPNFRDVGGYSCQPTSISSSESHQKFSIRPGYAYRCSELSQITPKGDEMLTGTLQIRTLFDLRSEREAADLHGQPKGVKCISTPVFQQGVFPLSMGIQQLQWSTAPDKPRNAGFSQGYVDWYRQIAIYGAKYAYKLVFEHIRDRPDEPFVFHCTAGKDRTGVLSALMLNLCGVDNHTIAWEYALTVPGMGVWEEAVEQEMVGDSMMPIRSHGGMTKEEAARVCGSRASNMDRWLKVVLDGEFGGAAKYLEEHCKLSKADVDKIKKNLIISGEGSVKAVELPISKEHPQT